MAVFVTKCNRYTIQLCHLSTGVIRHCVFFVDIDFGECILFQKMTNTLLVIFTSCFITVTAICSGLNVALMALYVTDLKRQAKLGNKDAKNALFSQAHSYKPS